MVKLKEAWAILPTLQGQALKDMQIEINRTESYCIEKGFAGIKSLTDWTTYKPKIKKEYRHEAGRDGGHNIPQGANTGYNRCGCCKFNNRAYCDPSDLSGHRANV